jgi:hypothetical protein
MDLIVRGYTNPQIAETLDVSLDGAKWHVREILSKLGVDTREEAAEYWRAYNGLNVRLTRLFRGFAGLAVLRWSAIAVAMLGGVTILVYALAWRGGDDSTPASPETPALVATPTPTPEPTATTPTVPVMAVSPSFRDFAHAIEKALQSNDASFFREAALTERVVCGPDDIQQPGTGCTMVGQEFDGLGLSYWRSDAGGIAPLENVVTTIERLWTESMTGGSDAYGDAGPHVYALGTRPALPGTPPLHVAVLTAMIEGRGGAEGQPRVAVVTFWHEVEGEWRYPQVLAAFVLGEEFLEAGGLGVESGWMATWERFDR